MDRSYFELYKKFNQSLYFWSSSNQKTTYTAWTSCEAENYIKYKYPKSAKNQLHSCTMNDISIFLISSWSQYIFYHEFFVDTKLRVFQYKILKNILFVNKMLFKVRKVQSPSYPYCKRKDETYIHLFYRYGKTSILWKQLQSFFSNTLSLFSISLQSATFGFLDDALEYKHLLNDILLILLI